VVPFFKNDDFSIGMGASNAGCGAHSGGIATNDNESLFFHDDEFFSGEFFFFEMMVVFQKINVFG
jgi:hypothetical protein